MCWKTPSSPDISKALSWLERSPARTYCCIRAEPRRSAMSYWRPWRPAWRWSAPRPRAPGRWPGKAARSSSAGGTSSRMTPKSCAATRNGARRLASLRDRKALGSTGTRRRAASSRPTARSSPKKRLQDDRCPRSGLARQPDARRRSLRSDCSRPVDLGPVGEGLDGGEGEVAATRRIDGEHAEFGELLGRVAADPTHANQVAGNVADCFGLPARLLLHRCDA